MLLFGFVLFENNKNKAPADKNFKWDRFGIKKRKHILR
jgi:hypothetical protein